MAASIFSRWSDLKRTVGENESASGNLQFCAKKIYESRICYGKTVRNDLIHIFQLGTGD